VPISQHIVRSVENNFAPRFVPLSVPPCYTISHTKIHFIVEAYFMDNSFPFEKFLKTVPEKKSSNNNDLDIDLLNLKNDVPTILKQEESTKPNSSQNQANQLEIEVLNIVESKIDASQYRTFVSGKIALNEINGQIALFTAQTKFIQSNAESNLKNIFSDALSELLGERYDIIFEMKSPSFSIENLNEDSTQKRNPSFTLDLKPTQNDLQSQAQSQYIEHMNKDLYAGQTIDPKKTFDNFIVGPSNNLAFATACAVSDSPGKSGKYPCLYIYSDSGLGKTHLLHAAANGIKDNHLTMTICLITAREFMKELINAYKDKKLSEFQKKYSETVDVLMIDDIHELKNKNSTQEEFFHIFNFLHDKGKQLIFTSDKSPDKITGVEERIITRLQWGLVIDIQKPDIETRTAILKKKALELDFFVQDDVLAVIATAIKTSIRELEGSLIKLQASAELMDVEIDTEMAKDILKLQIDEDRTPITLESISKSTSQYFKIPLVDLKSKSRNKDLVNARHIAWYLSKNITSITYKEIAKYYGDRDHSSIIHGVNKIADKIKVDSNLSRDLVFLENSL
jgi:chromosomal replication initiator protein